jgi:hypothetical protein
MSILIYPQHDTLGQRLSQGPPPWAPKGFHISKSTLFPALALIRRHWPIKLLPLWAWDRPSTKISQMLPEKIFPLCASYSQAKRCKYSTCQFLSDGSHSLRTEDNFARGALAHHGAAFHTQCSTGNDEIFREFGPPVIVRVCPAIYVRA